MPKPLNIFPDYQVKPDAVVKLQDHAPDDQQYFDGDKDAAKHELKQLRRTLADLQYKFYSDGRRRFLIVLQAMDTAGKDGTIRHIFKGVNPQGVRVASFKKPSANEFSRDYLWRVHQQVPRDGEIVIFNRSHYEDVLVPAVHKLVKPGVIKKRYQQLADFERMLSEEGTVILKFFLHIDKDEQKHRLQARLDNPKKHWKFDPNDLAERERWPRYQKAYEALLGPTSRPWAPWYIIPANDKNYRNLIIGRAIVARLQTLNLRYPKPDFDPKTIHIT